MPNTFAYLMLLAWPVVAAVLFRLMPLQKALVWTMIGGYLILPSATSMKIPMLPAIDKATVTSVSALFLCKIYAPPSAYLPGMAGRTGRIATGILVFLLIVSPFATVLTNPEAILSGPTFIAGLRLYDAASMISVIVVSLLPFWLGVRYLNDREGHRILLKAFVIGALVYSVPALIEVRLSPQLHTWVYGFFQHDFAQHVRAGGFRPILFLSHGLMVGIFLCMAAVAALALWREELRLGKATSGWIYAAIWLLIILVISKNLGALAIAALVAPLAVFSGRRVIATFALVTAAVIILYPMLRGTGLIPVQAIYDFAVSIDAERAESLNFRLVNEDLLLAHANEKAWFGWGSWGRNMLYDAETGRAATIADGVWVIIIGIHGWIGYIAFFGLLTLPVLFYVLRRTQFGPSFITPGLMLVLCVTLIDMIPNAGLVGYVWLMSGAIAGYVLWRPADAAESLTAVDARSGAAAFGPATQKPPIWVMSPISPAQRQPRTSRERGFD